MDEHGNYRDVAQSSGSFETNEITWVVEAPLPCFILRVHPLFTNDRQQNATGGNTFVDHLAKIAPHLDRRYIHEHRVLAEFLDQIVEQTSRFAFRVVSTVADEDRTHFESRCLGPVFAGIVAKRISICLPGQGLYGQTKQTNLARG